MSDIFVSYASEDRDRIMPLVRALEDSGWSVFWDRTIPVGGTWRQVIGTEIDTCRCMVVVWSAISIDKNWVHEEADEGNRRGVLAPVLIDDILPPIGFRSIQAAKLVGWDGKAPSAEFDRLLNDLSNILGTAPTKVEDKQKRQAELEAAHQAEEQAAKEREERQNLEAEAKRKAEQEAARKAEVEQQQRAEQEARRKAEEKRKQEEEATKQEAARAAASKSTEPPPTAGQPEGTRPASPKIIALGGIIVAVVILALVMIDVGQREHVTDSELAPSAVNPPTVAPDTQRIVQQQKEIERREQEAKITDLLARGAAAEAALRLTTPEHDNAVAYYREVLALDANNAAAREGLNSVTEQYLARVEQALAQRRFDKVEDDLAKARSVDPDHPALHRLAEQLDAERKAEEEAKRLAELEVKRKAEEEAKRKAEEARRKAEEEAKRLAELEVKRKAKVPSLLDQWAKDITRREEEAKRKAEEARRKAEEEAKRKAEEAKRKTGPDRVPFTMFGDVLKDGGEGPEMVVIPAGSFRRGDIQGGGDHDERPVREVRIGQPFAVGRYEVTFDEYDRFAHATGRSLPDDEQWGRGRRPVINVSWNDAVAYTEWLSRQTGKRYRLPSEAEWEYACRSEGKPQPYCGGDDRDELAWYWINSGGETHPVGGRAANGLGLFDMSGNAWEWTQDCYIDSYKDAPRDGSPRETNDDSDCSLRVLRGGSWINQPQGVRSSNRTGSAPGGSSGIGFRLARTL